MVKICQKKKIYERKSESLSVKKGRETESGRANKSQKYTVCKL